MRGHVRRRGKGWAYVVELPRVEGKRKQEWSGQYGSQSEAEAALSLRLVQVGSGVGTAPTVETVGAYARAWVNRRLAQGEISEASAITYRERIARWRKLNDLSLRRLRTADVEAWFIQALNEWSARTVSHALSLLKTVLDDAVKRKVIPENVADGVRAPRTRRFVGNVWSAEQAQYFLNYIQNDAILTAFVALALGSGARSGELIALRREGDIDYDKRIVHVSRTAAKHVGRGIQAKEGTKTRAGMRSIIVDAETLATVRNYVANSRDSVYVFGTEWQSANGMVGSHTLERRFTNYQRLYNADYAEEDGRALPFLRVHDLRHTHATWLIEAGVSLLVVAARLGHANANITLGLYGHLLRDREAHAADLIGRLLHGD